MNWGAGTWEVCDMGGRDAGFPGGYLLGLEGRFTHLDESGTGKLLCDG